MKYWEMIKTNRQPSLTASVDCSKQADDENMMKIIDEMKKINSSYSDKTTSLTEDEVSEVLSMLLNFQEKYFSEIPLSDDLSKDFVWNLPRSIYNLAIKSTMTDQIDCLNPIFWFYVMCVPDIDKETLAKYILLAFNSISDADKDKIELLSDMYDDMTTDNDDEDGAE